MIAHHLCILTNCILLYFYPFPSVYVFQLIWTQKSEHTLNFISLPPKCHYVSDKCFFFLFFACCPTVYQLYSEHMIYNLLNASIICLHRCQFTFIHLKNSSRQNDWWLSYTPREKLSFHMFEASRAFSMPTFSIIR